MNDRFEAIFTDSKRFWATQHAGEMAFVQRPHFNYLELYRHRKHRASTPVYLTLPWLLPQVTRGRPARSLQVLISANPASVKQACV